MPDPHKDLADIVEPQIATLATTSSDWQIVGAVLIGGVAVAAVLYWQWRRSAPLRTLHRLRRRSDVQQAANELAALLPRFKRAPDAAWLDALQRLRFGPARKDAQAVFDTLCEQAMLSLSPSRTERQTISPLPPGEGQG